MVANAAEGFLRGLESTAQYPSAWRRGQLEQRQVRGKKWNVVF